MSDPGYLDNILLEGAGKASEIAEITLNMYTKPQVSCADCIRINSIVQNLLTKLEGVFFLSEP